MENRHILVINEICNQVEEQLGKDFSDKKNWKRTLINDSLCDQINKEIHDALEMMALPPEQHSLLDNLDGNQQVGLIESVAGRLDFTEASNLLTGKAVQTSGLVKIFYQDMQIQPINLAEIKALQLLKFPPSCTTLFTHDMLSVTQRHLKGHLIEADGGAGRRKAKIVSVFRRELNLLFAMSDILTAAFNDASPVLPKELMPGIAFFTPLQAVKPLSLINKSAANAAGFKFN